MVDDFLYTSVVVYSAVFSPMCLKMLSLMSDIFKMYAHITNSTFSLLENIIVILSFRFVY